jgi:DNA-binding NarL/FixJ family response regulator
VTIRVLLADDQPLIRTALQMVITDTDDIEVAGEVQLVIIAYDAGLVAPAR